VFKFNLLITLSCHPKTQVYCNLCSPASLPLKLRNLKWFHLIHIGSTFCHQEAVFLFKLLRLEMVQEEVYNLFFFNKLTNQIIKLKWTKWWLIFTKFIMFNMISFNSVLRKCLQRIISILDIAWAWHINQWMILCNFMPPLIF